MPDVQIDEKKFAEQVSKELRNIADKIFSKSQQNIIDRNISNTAFLLKSGNVIKVNDLHYQIVYPAPYAEYVEFGTDPHMPPIKPLEMWARTKLGKTDKKAKSTAWAVAMKIKKQGLEPRPFLRDALDSVR